MGSIYFPGLSTKTLFTRLVMVTAGGKAARGLGIGAWALVWCDRWRCGDGGPCVELRPFVEAYSAREVEFEMRHAYVPLPARRDCFLEFYLQGRYRVLTVATGAEHWAPRCLLVGPSTQRREDLKLSGSLRVFSIRCPL